MNASLYELRGSKGRACRLLLCEVSEGFLRYEARAATAVLCPSIRRWRVAAAGLVTLVTLVSPASVRAETVLLGSDESQAEFATPANWDSYWGAGTTLSAEAAGGSPDNAVGWLRVTFNATVEDPPGDEWRELAYVSAANIFAGTWDTSQWVDFDFWQDATIASGLAIRWNSVENPGNWWTYTLDPVEASGWNTYSASLSNWENWAYPFSDEATYLADLASIDWIGIYMYRTTADEEIYGIDNVRLSAVIPEPAECILLIAAGISSAISLRRKRKMAVQAAS